MKFYLLAIWSVLDPIYFYCTRLQYVVDRNKKQTLFRVRLTRYKGGTVQLKDGTFIKKNDLLLKIHLHNVKLLSELYPVKNEVKKGLIIYRLTQQALPDLSQYIQSHHQSKNIKGIIGITTMHRGAHRLGFEIIPIRSVLYRKYKQITFLLINLLANSPRKNEPSYLLMSKRQLMNKYF